MDWTGRRMDISTSLLQGSCSPECYFLLISSITIWMSWSGFLQHYISLFHTPRRFLLGVPPGFHVWWTFDKIDLHREGGWYGSWVWKTGMTESASGMSLYSCRRWWHRLYVYTKHPMHVTAYAKAAYRLLGAPISLWECEWGHVSSVGRLFGVRTVVVLTLMLKLEVIGVCNLEMYMQYSWVQFPVWIWVAVLSTCVPIAMIVWGDVSTSLPCDNKKRIASKLFWMI